MLEFYQAYSNYEDLMKLTKELVSTIALEVNGTTILPSGEVDEDGKPIPRLDQFGKPINLAPENWQELTMREAIIKFWPPECLPPPDPSDFSDYHSLEKAVSRIAGYRASIAKKERDDRAGKALSLDEMVARQPRFKELEATISIWLSLQNNSSPLGKIIADLFELLAESHLIQPTIIYDFPLAVSPLSKIKPDEPEWVERFEFYIGGFEIGNAFSELNDPDDQRRRFEAQLLERERGDDEAHAMDEDYVRALGYGLPPTAGEGVGIDRLTMVLTGSKSIRDVILFPLLRPQTAKPDAPE
jgi:lysyl-tRNA synthetase class 2